MKRLRYKIFKKEVFIRAVGLKAKQQARIQRLQKVLDELREWDDIPISWQFTGLCKTLKIEPDESARKFIISLNCGNINLEKTARMLPLGK